jgi:anti-sigma regulatory factor (Ser/Thr protein kinase)
MQLNLALEEAVVNVMSYAYPEGTKGYVDIKAESDETYMKFIITDRGTPFDPTTKEEVDTTLPIEERRIGGLGIFLVRKMMDAIEYEYKDGQNILTLKKKNK